MNVPFVSAAKIMYAEINLSTTLLTAGSAKDSVEVTPSPQDVRVRKEVGDPENMTHPCCCCSNFLRSTGWNKRIVVTFDLIDPKPRYSVRVRRAFWGSTMSKGLTLTEP